MIRPAQRHRAPHPPFRPKWSTAKVVVAALLSSSLAGCFAAQLPGDGSSGSADDATPAHTSTTGTSGISCGQDPNTGITLCLGTTACPDDQIDANAYPGCGFRTLSGTFDLECLCSGTELCPIGVATSCGGIDTLLEGRDVADICSELGSGSCTALATAPATTTAGAGGAATTSSTCDPSCAADCAGSPICRQACGC